MKELNIGLDLDGVICDSAPLIVGAIYNKFAPGRPFKEKYGLEAYLLEELKVPAQEILDVAAQVLTSSEFYQKAKLVEGASQGVLTLKNMGNILHIVSHRPDTVYSPHDVYNLSKSWLYDRGINDQIASLTFNPSHSDRAFKAQYARDAKFDVYVDDELEEAKKFAGMGIKTIFFDGDVEIPQIENLTVARSWKEIVSKIEEFAEKLHLTFHN